MRWKFSHLKNTFAPVSSSTVLEVSTGVRFACARMRSWAAATSSKETISAPVLERRACNVIPPFLQEVPALRDDVGFGTVADLIPKFVHHRRTEDRIFRADIHECFAFPRCSQIMRRFPGKGCSRIVRPFRHQVRKAPHAGMGVR